jgi:hypothetical protein
MSKSMNSSEIKRNLSVHAPVAATDMFLGFVIWTMR